jgi:myo-inositol catabolism protein IolC
MAVSQVRQSYEKVNELMEIPRRLYMLPFDHRDSFEHKLFGFKGTLDSEETSQIIDAKRLIYEGFLLALESDVPRDAAAILVDEQFGRDVLRDAKARGLMTACPVEHSGKKEFTFEYGDDFAAHIEDVDPTFCKVLVRYNPEGDVDLNRRQSERLRRLSDYLSSHGRDFLMELLVPAEPHQLTQAGGDQGKYDSMMRPGLMVRAIEDFHHRGIEPTIWKIEGLDSTIDCQHVAETALRDGRSHVRCIVLGRDAPVDQVERWLRAAAVVPAFVGFAVGRSTFAEALRAWRDGKATRVQAVQEVARWYGRWTRTFIEAQASGLPHAQSAKA